MSILQLVLSQFIWILLKFKWVRGLRLMHTQNLIQHSQRQYQKDTEIKRLLKRVNNMDSLLKSTFLTSKMQRRLLKYNRFNKGSIINMERRIKQDTSQAPKCFEQSSSTTTSEDECEDLQMPFDGSKLPKHLTADQCLKHLRHTGALESDNGSVREGGNGETTFQEFFGQFMNFHLIKNLDLEKGQREQIVRQYPWQAPPMKSGHHGRDSLHNTPRDQQKFGSARNHKPTHTLETYEHLVEKIKEESANSYLLSDRSSSSSKQSREKSENIADTIEHLEQSNRPASSIPFVNDMDTKFISQNIIEDISKKSNDEWKSNNAKKMLPPLNIKSLNPMPKIPKRSVLMVDTSKKDEALNDQIEATLKAIEIDHNFEENDQGTEPIENKFNSKE